MKSIMEVALLAAWVGYNRLRSFGNGQEEEEEEEDGIAYSTSKVGWFYSAAGQYDTLMGNFKSSAQFGLWSKIWDWSCEWNSTCLLLSQAYIIVVTDAADIVCGAKQIMWSNFASHDDQFVTTWQNCLLQCGEICHVEHWQISPYL